MNLNTPHRPKIIARPQWSVLRREPCRIAAKHYLFETPQGTLALEELFAGRSRLIVRHLVLGCGHRESCAGCEFLADHVEPALLGREHAEVACVAVSQAPLFEIEAFKRRMGFDFRWLSCLGSDFNRDYHVAASGRGVQRSATSADRPGVSTFYRDRAGTIFHAGSCYVRGLDVLLATEELVRLAPALPAPELLAQRFEP
jgi:predicted dithiol-disulfide oxidoreductase (DUF899 family)